MALFKHSYTYNSKLQLISPLGATHWGVSWSHLWQGFTPTNSEVFCIVLNQKDLSSFCVCRSHLIFQMVSELICPFWDRPKKKLVPLKLWPQNLKIWHLQIFFSDYHFTPVFFFFFVLFLKTLDKFQVIFFASTEIFTEGHLKGCVSCRALSRQFASVTFWQFLPIVNFPVSSVLSQSQKFFFFLDRTLVDSLLTTLSNWLVALVHFVFHCQQFG